MSPGSESSVKRVLVTGANGQLGRSVVRVMSDAGYHVIAAGHSDLDVSDPVAVSELFKCQHPDMVVHCAAWTKVDAAEDFPEECRSANVIGTRNVVDACIDADVPIVYLSTDYVFDGTGTEPWKPGDRTNPLNVYGMSKLDGEIEVRRHVKHFIIRISWVFGPGGSNFVYTMMRLAGEGRQPKVVDDQVGSPTYTEDLAQLIRDMLETDLYGTYHAHNEGFCSWHEFACEIFCIAGSDIVPIPIFSKEYISKATRPLNGRLDTACLTKARFEKLPSWNDALKRFMESV